MSTKRTRTHVDAGQRTWTQDFLQFRGFLSQYSLNDSRLSRQSDPTFLPAILPDWTSLITARLSLNPSVFRAVFIDTRVGKKPDFLMFPTSIASSLFLLQPQRFNVIGNLPFRDRDD